MSTTRLLLDSNILILAANGQVSADAIFDQYDEMLVSVISEVEALGYAAISPAEELAIRQALATMQILPFTAAEAHYAIGYRKTRPVMKFPDAAILATARAAGADLLTQNTKEFIDRDPAVRVLAVQDL